MRLTYKKQKEKFSIMERKTLLSECASLVNKDVVLLKIEDPRFFSDARKIQVCVGKIESVEWSVFLDYPEFSLKMYNGGQVVKVDASRWGTIMFENIADINEVLAEFLYGSKFNFHPSLRREYRFKDLLWPINKDNSFRSSYSLSEGNQILYFDKKEGSIEVVKVNSLGDKWTLTNKQEFSIFQEELCDTDEYSYYKLEADEDSYTIDKNKDFYGDIRDFIVRQLFINVEDEQLGNNNTVSTDMNSEELLKKAINEDLLKQLIAEVIADKMPEIMEEVLYRMQK